MLINMIKTTPLAWVHWRYHHFQCWRRRGGVQWSVIFYSDNMLDPCYPAERTPATVIFSLKFVQCEGEGAHKLTFGYKAVDMSEIEWYHGEKMSTLALHETTNFGRVLMHEPATWLGRVPDWILRDCEFETHARAFTRHMVRHWDNFKGETAAWGNFEAWMQGEPDTRSILERDDE